MDKGYYGSWIKRKSSTIDRRKPGIGVGDCHLEAARLVLAGEGCEVLTLAGDVTNPETAQRLIESTVSAFGGLDLLFTNAGGPPPGAFEAIADETWSQAVDTSA